MKFINHKIINSQVLLVFITWIISYLILFVFYNFTNNPFISNLIITQKNFIFLVIVSILFPICFLCYYYYREFKFIKVQKIENEKLNIVINNLSIENAELKTETQQAITKNIIENFESVSRIASVLAHEVKNPLTNIGLANDQLKDAIVITEEGRILIGMIKRNGERINNLVSDFLLATKFSELNYDAVPINYLIDDLLDSLKDNIFNYKITIVKEYAHHEDEICGDADKISFALNIILMQAIQFINTPPCILKIITKLDSAKFYVSITISKTNISNDYLTKVLEPFFTKDDSKNGLSLTQANSIIINHRGTIQIKNTPENEIIFFINLPVNKQ